MSDILQLKYLQNSNRIDRPNLWADSCIVPIHVRNYGCNTNHCRRWRSVGSRWAPVRQWFAPVVYYLWTGRHW